MQKVEKLYPVQAETYPNLVLREAERDRREAEISAQLMAIDGNLRPFENWERICGSRERALIPVNVVIPAYREPSLANTLLRVKLSQIPSDVPFNVVCVCDGGLEDSLTPARDFARAVLLDSIIDREDDLKGQGVVDRILQEFEAELPSLDGENFSVTHGNFSFTCVAEPRRGKVGAIKRGLDLLPETQEVIIGDADCIYDPKAIPLVHATMMRFPELLVAGGRRYALFDGEKISRGRDRLMPRSVQAFKRVEAGIFSTKVEPLKSMPDHIIRDDCFFEVWANKYNVPWAFIPEAVTYHPISNDLTDLVNTRLRMEDGSRQLMDFFNLTRDPDSEFGGAAAWKASPLDRAQKLLRAVTNPSDIPAVIAYFRLRLAVQKAYTEARTRSNVSDNGAWESPKR